MMKLRAVACALALWSAGAAHAAPADLVPPSGAWVKISVAELRARYDTLWAVSDLHGRREELERLLVASRLAVRTGPTITWNGERRRQLLIVAGDLIDGGPDSVGVVLLLDRLQREASAADSGIIVLLGNHEAAFLANPRSATRELLSSAALHAAELGLPRRITPKRLDASAVGAFLRGLPVAAFVGTWLFAHAGYIDAGKGERELGEYFARLGDTVGRRDRDAFAALLDPGSIVAYHNWWRSDRLLAKMRRRLDVLGMNGLVIGHDPDALGAPERIAMNRDGWLLKLDTGLKTGSSAGMLLRCEVAQIVSSDELVMARDGAPTCRTETPVGSGSPWVAK
jgi:hypothetical protein